MRKNTSQQSSSQQSSSLNNIKDLYKKIQQITDKYDYDYTTAKMPHNIVKNRYHNVLPNENYRFKSINVDYINASIYKSYILTQGPIDGLIHDFWAMIWDSKCSIIVALARCNEDGRSKYDAYFNDEFKLLPESMMLISQKDMFD